MNKFFLLTAIMLLLLYGNSIAENKFHVWTKGDTSPAYSENDSCLISVTSDNSVSYFKLSSVQKIVVNSPSATDQTGSSRILFGLPESSTQSGETKITGGLIYSYPNPVIDLLHLKGAKNCDIQIFDLNGTLYRQTTSNEEETTIPASDLKSGIYFMKVGNKTIKFNKK